MNDVQLGKTWALFKIWMNRLWTSEHVSQDEKNLWTPMDGEKKTGVDAGVYGQISITDDYIYVCVQTGVAGVAIWKRSVLFQT